MMTKNFTSYLTAVLLTACASHSPAPFDITSDDSVVAAESLDIEVMNDDAMTTLTATLGDRTTSLVADPGTPGRYIGSILAPVEPGDYDLEVSSMDPDGKRHTARQREHVRPDDVLANVPEAEMIGHPFDIGVGAPGATSATANFSIGGHAGPSVMLSGDGAGNFSGVASLETFGTWFADIAVTYPDGKVEHRGRAITLGTAELRSALQPAVSSVGLEGSYVTYNPELIAHTVLSPMVEESIAANAQYMSKELAAGHLQVVHAPYAVIPEAIADLDVFGLVPTEAGLSLGIYGTIGLAAGAHVDVEFGWTGLYIHLNKEAIQLLAKGTLAAGAAAALLGVSEPVALALIAAGSVLDLESALSEAVGGDGGVTVCFLGYNPLIPPVVTPNF